MIKQALLWLFKKSIDLTVINVSKQQNPVVYVCNHTSFADGAVLASCLDNPVFVVHKDLADSKRYRSVLRFIDHVLVSPDKPMSIRQIFRFIKQGRSIVVFPEGRLTVTGSLMKVYPGAAYIALKAGVPIVPLTIQGLVSSVYSKLKGDNPNRWFPKITLRAGPEIAPLTSFKKRNDLEQGTKKIKDSLVALAYEGLNDASSLHAALQNAITNFGGNRPVLEELSGAKISYKKFYMMAQGLGYFIEKSIGKNQTAGVFLPNISATAALLFGFSIINKRPALLNYSMGKDPFISCLKTAGLKTVFTSKAFIKMGNLDRFIEYMKESDVTVVYLEDLKVQAKLADKLKILKRTFFTYAAPRSSADEIILFTSGSEGLPKGVVLPHTAILANVAQIRSIVDISVNDKVFNAMPLFHSFGLTAGTVLPLLSGSKLVLYPTPLHYKKIPELVYDKDCTVLFGTNTFLTKYAKEAHPYDFFRLRYVVAGAEKVLDSTRNTWFEKFGIRIFEGYGATECAPVLCVNTPAANKFGTVGKFLPQIQYTLDPIPGVEASEGCQAGKLLVSGPNLYSGYLRPVSNVFEKATPTYDTGDIVEVDAEGFVRILGRAKRFVKIAGEMVSLEAVEKTAALVSTSPNAAIGIADPQLGERVVLYTTDPSLTIASISHYVSQNSLSKLWVPYKVILLKEIPLLGTGKTDYQALKQLSEQSK